MLSSPIAYARPGVFDKSKTDVVVLLADASIPQDAAHDNFALREKLPQFLSFTLDADGQIITLRPQPRPSRP